MNKDDGLDFTAEQFGRKSAFFEVEDELSGDLPVSDFASSRWPRIPLTSNQSRWRVWDALGDSVADGVVDSLVRCAVNGDRPRFC